MNIELGMGQVKTQLESSMNCLTHSRQEIMEMSQVGKEHFHQLDLIDSKEKLTWAISTWLEWLTTKTWLDPPLNWTTYVFVLESQATAPDKHSGKHEINFERSLFFA